MFSIQIYRTRWVLNTNIVFLFYFFVKLILKSLGPMNCYQKSSHFWFTCQKWLQVYTPFLSYRQTVLHCIHLVIYRIVVWSLYNSLRLNCTWILCAVVILFRFTVARTRSLWRVLAIARVRALGRRRLVVGITSAMSEATSSSLTWSVS